jgi:hypothetical protein
MLRKSGLFMLALASASARAESTPIKHVVVIFQENVSFDHYFATYPQAANPPGEPRFVARRGTPSVNGLTGALLTLNNSFNTTFGPSTPGALNLVSGQTHGATPPESPGNTVAGTVIDDLRRGAHRLERQAEGRLHPAPRAVPVPSLDLQCATPRSSSPTTTPTAGTTTPCRPSSASRTRRTIRSSPPEAAESPRRIGAGPLRVRPATAAPGDLALGESDE